MGDGFVQRSQSVHAVRAVRRVLAPVIEQPRVGRLERLRLVPLQLGRKVLADQRVSVELHVQQWAGKIFFAAVREQFVLDQRGHCRFDFKILQPREQLS